MEKLILKLRKNTNFSASIVKYIISELYTLPTKYHELLYDITFSHDSIIVHFRKDINFLNIYFIESDIIKVSLVCNYEKNIDTNLDLIKLITELNRL